MMFTGFKKCFFPTLKFDSDSERMLACILERDDDVRRWLRPPERIFQIDYRHGEGYEPDFVVETETGKFMVEVKRRSDLEHPDVLDKKEAAVAYCKHATQATGIQWSYILIPHDAVIDSASFGGMVSKFRVG
jgi:type III restriction enzyme